MKIGPESRTEIVRRYLAGEKQADLAREFQVTPPTIHRIVKQLRNGEIPIPERAAPIAERSREVPPPPPPPDRLEPASIEDLDPVRFRRVKLAEIGQDLSKARHLGRVQALAGLHRLHLEVHDQAVACIESRGDDISGTTQEEQEQIIFSELASLPPALRHRLLDHLEALDAGKVLTMPSKSSKVSEG